MLQKISDSVWKIQADGNVYFLDLKIPTIIDTSHRLNRELVKKSITELINPKKIKRVIFTHLHTDHIGNFDLFSGAEFFASNAAIKCLKKDHVSAILDPSLAKKFNVGLKPAEDIKDLEVILTPGHTLGSICIWLKEEKILFSGDTLFRSGIGRVDLPTSEPEKMQESLAKLEKYKFKILAPGHDY